ncbi:hypothetical protein QAD02_000131, partial [Eretmocerus hayati]
SCYHRSSIGETTGPDKMKFFIAFLSLAAVALARPQQQPVYQILRMSKDISPEGNYQYGYETENGIAANEAGGLKQIGQNAAVVASGNYAYTGDDGQSYQVSYVADENGYQPQARHLPVAPPVPEAIQRALDYIAAHPPPPEQRR